MGMDLEYVPVPVPEPAGPRLHRRILEAMGRRIAETYRYDTLLWRSALAGLWIVCFLAFSVTMLGIPTGLGIPADIALAAAAGTIVLALAGNILAVLLALTGLPVPRLFTGSIVTVTGVIFLILYYADLEIEPAAAIAAAATLTGALAGIALGLLRSRRIVTGLLLAAALTLSSFAVAGSWTEATPAGGYNGLIGSVDQLAADNPSLPGPYAYTSFTYASGKDLHRTEYGQEADMQSSPADASAYIKTWPKLRSLFWGFNPSSLPLNGRVWMPEGEGPYPLVLMVHGNHMMEDYSDAGYAYLGELLASRGFIAVSIDENFLNYSAWTGIPDNDFKIRAWLILKHLEQLEQYAKQPDNLFYQRIDPTQTALLGHSRGGQAVAMAADAARFFKADSALDVTRRFHITSVIALAPTDKSIDSQQARLKDVNYLTLQGARDGDVHDFYGDRQYIRSGYSSGSAAFKSSLYIADANHSQFNTDWGLRDQSLPTGLFLSRRDIMDGTEQRQIAKVYVSAFLEATLHKDSRYTRLFRDYRSGLQWLPSTSYFNRYQSGSFSPVVTFDEDRNRNTAGAGGTAEGKGLRWMEELAKDRELRSKGTYGLVLERTALENAEALYTIKLSNSGGNLSVWSGADGLSFSMSNLKGIAPSDKDSSTPAPPEVEIELTDSSNTSVRLPLTEVMDVLPLPRTWFTVTKWLEERISNNKFGDLSEAVFQTYEIPFERFLEKNTAFNPAEINAITFYLKKTGDKVMLDDIGFYTE
jgi:dienelactone hydrolase